jgi:hypothetical protein
MQSPSASDYLQQQAFGGVKRARPVMYFDNEENCEASVMDAYAAEVKRILEMKKNDRNAPGSGGGYFSRLNFRSNPQRKQPEHGNVRILLASMK